jgi:hypothetical protein
MAADAIAQALFDAENAQRRARDLEQQRDQVVREAGALRRELDEATGRAARLESELAEAKARVVHEDACPLCEGTGKCPDLGDPNVERPPDSDDGWNARTADVYRRRYGEEPPRRLYNPGTPVALDRGEAVAEAREKLWTLIRNYRAESAGDLVGVAGAIGRIVDPLFGAAEKWAALQWREPSTAPVNQRLLVLTKHGEVGITTVHSSLGADYSFVGWLPLDALPALPSEPVKPNKETLR